MAIGLHTGEAVPVSRRYLSLAVPRAFITCEAAHGGQVLLSESTAGLVDDDDLRELRLRDLGQHELRSFERPTRLFQLEIPGLPTEFPPPRVTVSKA
jgi:class 3 adenylate cyclase